MLRRTFVLMAAAMAVWAGPALAELEVGTFEGKVVKVAAGELTYTDNRGGDFTLPVPEDAVVTFDGEACKLTDLKAGAAIKGTIEKKGEEAVVTRIEAK